MTTRSPEFVEKVFGGPGTGKTTYLMGRLVEEIHNGVSLDEITFIAFTRAARDAAQQKAYDALRDARIGAGDLPYFRTLYSLASRLVGASGSNFVTPEHRAYYAQAVGLQFDRARDASPEDVLDARLPLGNLVFHLEGWLTNTRTPVEEWRRSRIDHDAAPERIEQEVRRYRVWKQRCGLLDYPDILTRVLETGVTPPTRVLFVDEFQDLSPLQYAVYEQWAASQERVYIAGDDDQTIFGFQGASQLLLIRAPCTLKTVLATGRRVPSNVWGYSERLIGRVAEREPKTIRAEKTGGALRILERPSIEDIIRFLDPASSFILARTQRHVKRIAADLTRAGVPFTTIRDAGANATWTPDLAHLKTAYLRLYDGGDVTHETASALLRNLHPYDPASRMGHASEARVKAFDELRIRFAKTWPRDPLGQSLDSWTREQLGQHAIIPRRDEFFAALRMPERQKDALFTHLQQRPAWPIVIGENKGVRVGTIHSSKGREANAVVLLSDMSRRAVARMHDAREEQDSETRVFYVGATRALNALVVAQPYITSSHYEMPEASA